MIESYSNEINPRANLWWNLSAAKNSPKEQSSPNLFSGKERWRIKQKWLFREGRVSKSKHLAGGGRKIFIGEIPTRRKNKTVGMLSWSIYYVQFSFH